MGCVPALLGLIFLFVGFVLLVSGFFGAIVALVVGAVRAVLLIISSVLRALFCW